MKEPIKVLLIDDEENFRIVMSNELKRAGFHIENSSQGKEALARIPEFRPEVVLVDIQMPGMDGLSVMGELAGLDEPPEVIVLTGHSTVENAVEAMKLGAVDYITKPFNLDELMVVIRNAYDRYELKRQNRMLRAELAGRGETPEIFGESEAMKQLRDTVTRVASADSPILIVGESGAGKETIARVIHKNSARRNNPFISVDCCSIQPATLEIELFGEETIPNSPGSGTFARIKHGLIEVAESGTVYMDEIGETSPEIQSKLLRLIQTGGFRRTGGGRNIPANIRLIAATNRNIENLVKSGKFREDLFYVLNSVTIYIPSLRERKDDIPLLCNYALSMSVAPGGERKTIPPHVMEYLVAYDWWGNVRELMNAVKRAVIFSKNNELAIEDFNLPVRVSPGREPGIKSRKESEWDDLTKVEIEYIKKVLAATGGHRRRAAQILGISERSLYRKIKEGGE